MRRKEYSDFKSHTVPYEMLLQQCARLNLSHLTKKNRLKNSRRRGEKKIITKKIYK